jgi:hypothetical protein
MREGIHKRNLSVFTKKIEQGYGLMVLTFSRVKNFVKINRLIKSHGFAVTILVEKNSHGPFEWPFSCRLLCRWSLIYCDSENDVPWDRVFNLIYKRAMIMPRPVPKVLKMRSDRDEILVGRYT